MKNITSGLICALFLMPAAAFAQDADRSPLAGPHVGIDITRDSLKAAQPTSIRNASRKGVGAKLNLGYDAVLGDTVLVGAELGIGTGGKTVDQASLLGGRYKVDPGLTYDATTRVGIAPGGKFAVYGRAGYRWLKTTQSVSGQTAGNFSRKVTEKGFTYGGGAEYAVSENFSVRAEYNRTKYNKDLRQNKLSVGAAIRF